MAEWTSEGKPVSPTLNQRRSPSSEDPEPLQSSSLQRNKLQGMAGPVEHSRENNDPKNVLKKEITLSTGVAYLVGGTIGSGVFVTPRSILLLSHSFGLSMVVWVLGGIIAMLAGLCYIELGLLIGKSGAEYNILKEAYAFKSKHWLLGMLGEVLAFMYLWTMILLVRASSMAVVCLTSARYLVRPFYLGENMPEEWVIVIAIAIIILLAVVNCYGLKSAAAMMSFFTVCKLMTVVFIMLVGIYHLLWKEHQVPPTFWRPFENLNGELPTVYSVALSFYSVLFAYDGWNAMNYAVEETKDVHRTMPLSIYIGVTIVTISYCLINVSFFAVLTYEQIEQAVAVALPFSTATLGSIGLVVIPVLVAASAFGAANGSFYNSTRLMFVAAREGHAPKFLSGLHVTTKTPIAAVILQAVLGVAMVLLGSIEELIQGVTYSYSIFIFLSIIGLFIFRKTRPLEPRIFPAWFILPVATIMLCVCMFLLIVPVVQYPERPLISLAVMVTAVPVYVLLVMEKPFKLRPKFVDALNDKASDLIGSILNTQPAR